MSKKRRKTSGRVKKRGIHANIKQINLAIKQGNYDKAIIILKSSKSQMKEVPYKTALAELYFRRAHRYYGTNSRQVLADLEQAATLMPDDALYAYHIGLKYHHNNQLSEAIKWYAKSLERDATFERAVFSLALAHQENGDDVQTLAVWQQLSAEQQAYFSEDGGKANELLKGINALSNQDYPVAESHFQKFIDNQSSPALTGAMAYDYLGRLALQRDNNALEQAQDYWQKAYDAGLRSETFLENYATLYVILIEDTIRTDGINAATDLIEQGLKRFPDHPRLQEVQSYLQLQSGYDAAGNNDWESALKAWNSVKNASGEVARRLAANMALAYEKLERWSEAADSWREFARRRGRKEGAQNWLSPGQVARLWSRISNLYMRDGDEEEAITTLQTALKYDADNPDMGIELARRYAEAERFEASHNQIDRVIKAQSGNAKALSFKAELAEIAPLGWSRGNEQGMRAWEAVIDTGDEAYVTIAEHRLKQLYLDEFSNASSWYYDENANIKLCEKGLKRFPEFSELRANYIGALLHAGKSKKKIQKELDLIDLSNERALHRLIDLIHIFDETKMAEDLLKKANANAPLGTEFYTGIANCAVNREQYDIADGYFDHAVEICQDEDEQKRVLVSKASAYGSNGLHKEADAILKKVLRQDARYGPAHIAYALIKFTDENIKDAKWHLKKAEKWAKETGDRETLDVVESLRFRFENPLASLLPPGFDPSMLPPEFFDMDIDDLLDSMEDVDEEGWF